MITDQDRKRLRDSERTARGRIGNNISLEWLLCNGFETKGDGPVAFAGGIRVTVGMTAIESVIWLYLGNVRWPKPVKTQTQLLAIIAALEEE